MRRAEAKWKACWREVLLVVLMRYRHTLLWRLRKLLKHECAVRRRVIARRMRVRTPEQRRASRVRNHAAIRRKERAAEHKRRARQLQAGGTFSAQDIAELFEAQRGRCYWCHGSIVKTYHVDHVWPLAKGGSNGPENLVLACPGCNQRKHAKTPMEFAGRLL